MCLRELLHALLTQKPIDDDLNVNYFIYEHFQQEHTGIVGVG